MSLIVASLFSSPTWQENTRPRPRHGGTPPGQVLYLTTLLDRVLVKHKTIPPGDRMKYARSQKRKERQELKAQYK